MISNPKRIKEGYIFSFKFVNFNIFKLEHKKYLKVTIKVRYLYPISLFNNL